MTSMPASRRARATTLAPRSCPSSPGLAITTRIRPCATATSAPFSSCRREQARDPPLLGKILPVGGIAPAGAAPPGAERPSTEEPQSRAPGPDPPTRRLPAAEGGQSAQADPAQPARAAVDAGGDPVRAGDPGCGDAVPGQGRAPRRALAAGSAGDPFRRRRGQPGAPAGWRGRGGRPPRDAPDLPGADRLVPGG